VFIDGVDVLDIPLPALRGAIGYVSQEPFLFSEMLGANIAFGIGRSASLPRPDPAADGAPDAAEGSAVAAAAGVARLDKDVQEFPKGYQTLVGERGITLSGGQKPRTALARAVATDPRILILDDALSAVEHTEKSLAAAKRHAPAHLRHRVAPRLDGP
jgi:ATP-binding cassette subfamily B protein